MCKCNKAPAVSTHSRSRSLLPCRTSLLRLYKGVEGECKWNKGPPVSFLQDASSKEKNLKRQSHSVLALLLYRGTIAAPEREGGGGGGVS